MADSLNRPVAPGALSPDGEPVISTSGKWMVLLAAILGWMFDGLEMGLFPLVARPALYELMGEEAANRNFGTWMSVVMATFLIGAAAGGVLFGWLGDRIGRVRAMVWAVLTYAVFSGLCAFATEPWHLAVMRFIASLGMGGEWSLGVALVMEIWPAKSRPLMAGLIGMASNVGFLSIGVLSLYLNSVMDHMPDWLAAIGLSEDSSNRLIGADRSGWRLLMLAGALPAFLTFFIRLFVPESERWQHAVSTGPKARIADIFTPRLRRTTILGMLLGAVALLGTWGSVQWLPSWADSLAKGTDDAATARTWTHIYASIGAIVGSLAAAFLADLTNRRVSYFLLCAMSLGVCGYLFNGDLSYGSTFLLTVAAAGCVTASFYGWLPLYLPELFPTRVRATGQGFAFNGGRVFAAIGTVGGGQLLNAFEGDFAKTGSVTCLIYAVGLVLIWFCPETKGRPLPE